MTHREELIGVVGVGIHEITPMAKGILPEGYTDGKCRGRQTVFAFCKRGQPGDAR